MKEWHSALNTTQNVHLLLLPNLRPGCHAWNGVSAKFLRLLYALNEERSALVCLRTKRDTPTASRPDWMKKIHACPQGISACVWALHLRRQVRRGNYLNVLCHCFVMPCLFTSTSNHRLTFFLFFGKAEWMTHIQLFKPSSPPLPSPPCHTRAASRRHLRPNSLRPVRET